MLARPSKPREDAAATLAFAAVLSLAAWVRVARFAGPLAGGELIALDGDSHYHVRRIESALRGAIPTFDPLMNWPRGGSAPWADGFDLLGAAFAFLAGGGSDRPGTHVAVFLWPVVLGILAVWATIDLTRRLVPSRDVVTPLAAGLVAAFVPHFVDASSMGRVDHHVAEALSMLLLLSWSAERFRVEDEPQPGMAWEAAGAAAVAFAIWTFSGGILYVSLAAAPLGLAALGTRPGGRIPGSGAPALVAGALVGAALTVPAMRAHGRLISFMFPSLLQPALVAIAGMALAGAVLAGERLANRKTLVRLPAQLGAAAAVIVGALAVVPGLGTEVLGAVQGWMLQKDPWIASIAEFQPLLWDRARGEPGLLHLRTLLGPVGFLGAFALPLGVLVAWRYSPGRAASFALTSTALSAMALLQMRFTRLAAPLLAIAIALTLRGLRAGLARTPLNGRLAAWTPVLGAALLIVASPGMRGQAVPDGPWELLSLHRAALALRIDGPPVPGRRQGVLVPWDLGHAVMGLSGRPVPANGFGSYMDPETFRVVRDAFTGDERRLVAAMDALDLGFVLGGGLALANHQATATGESPAVGDPPALNPRFMRKTPMSQLLIAGSGLPEAGLPHLERLMPILASQATAGGLSFPLPVIWAFELVPGATITGNAVPGALVVGELRLEEWGRAHRYRAWTRAGADGRWSLRVAVPSGYVGHALRTGRAWSITEGDGATVEVEVPESMVRAGGQVVAP